MAFNETSFDTRGVNAKITFPGGEIVENSIVPKTLDVKGTQYNTQTLQVALRGTIKTGVISTEVSQAPQVMFDMVQNTVGSHRFLQIETYIAKYGAKCSLEMTAEGTTSAFKSFEVKDGIITMTNNRDISSVVIEGEISNVVY